jgi:hemerythrin
MSAERHFADCSTLPEVALPFMNTVHCEELTLVAGLVELLAKQADVLEIDACMAEWVAHTEAHFAREERLMAEYNFFAYPMHQGEHEMALQQLRDTQQRWLKQRDGNMLNTYILQWRAWLQQHVSSMDFVTAHYLSQFKPQVEL